MVMYTESDIIPNKNYFAPKTQAQEIVSHLRRKYRHEPWFSDIRINVQPNKNLIVYVWCNHEIDDTFMPHMELGYRIKYWWEHKKQIDLEEAEKCFVNKFKNENWFISCKANKLFKTLTVTSSQYPNRNIKVFPDVYKDYNVDYRYIDLDYDTDWFKPKYNIHDATIRYKNTYMHANWLVSVQNNGNDKLLVTVNQLPYINTAIIPDKFLGFNIDYTYIELDPEFE